MTITINTCFKCKCTGCSRSWPCSHLYTESKIVKFTKLESRVGATRGRGGWLGEMERFWLKLIYSFVFFIAKISKSFVTSKLHKYWFIFCLFYISIFALFQNYFSMVNEVMFQNSALQNTGKLCPHLLSTESLLHHCEIPPLWYTKFFQSMAYIYIFHFLFVYLSMWCQHHTVLIISTEITS